MILAELEDVAEAEPSVSTFASALDSASTTMFAAEVAVAVAVAAALIAAVTSSGVAVGFLANSSESLAFSRAALAEV